MTTTTTLCPTWCINDHTASRTVHYQADVHLPTMDGSPLPVSAFVTSDHHGVYVGGWKLTPETARELALVLLDRADLATEAAEDAGGLR